MALVIRIISGEGAILHLLIMEQHDQKRRKIMRTMRRTDCIISNFVCQDCGKVLMFPRNHGRQRKKNHIKDIYCPYCRDVRKFHEVTYKDSYVTADGLVIYS